MTRYVRYALGLVTLMAPFTASPVASAGYVWEFSHAQADGTPPSSAKCIDWSRAKVCFVATGDVIWVDDKDANGRSAGANFQIFRPDSSIQRFGTCESEIGAANGWATCNEDFDEDYRIRLQPAECRDNAADSPCANQILWLSFHGDWSAKWAIGQ